jgi:malic enzyme
VRNAVVKAVKPTVLIGTSTHSRAFNEEIIREMVCYVFALALIKLMPHLG